MPPNFNDGPAPTGANFVDNSKGQENSRSSSTSDTVLKLTRTSTTLMAHFLIGIVCGANIIFAFRNGVPLSVTNQHIILCVLGFQFLMAESILCLAPDNWLSTLGLKHKRWVHLVMQIVGSVLAIYGCIIMSLSKNINWNTLHGQFALVAMVFTTVSLVNGFSSLYAYELRRILPGSLSKLTHICFGIVAVAAASISLGYGFDKFSFRTWATTRFADALIIMTGVFTTIVIINPLIVFYRKFVAVFSN